LEKCTSNQLSLKTSLAKESNAHTKMIDFGRPGEESRLASRNEVKRGGENSLRLDKKKMLRFNLENSLTYIEWR